MAAAAVFLAVTALFLVAHVAGDSMSIVAYDESHGLAVEPAERTEAELRSLYESWAARHGKSYNGLEEKDMRFEVFKDNLRFIDRHNAAGHSYKLGLNRFADLTNEEYRAAYLGARMGGGRRLGRRRSGRYAVQAGEELPESVDWRDKGAVADIKDQGSCGECDCSFVDFVSKYGVDWECRIRFAFIVLFSVSL